MRLMSTLSKQTLPIYIRGGTVVNADQQFKANVMAINGKITGVHRFDEKVQIPNEA